MQVSDRDVSFDNLYRGRTLGSAESCGEPFGLSYQKYGQACFQFSGKPVDGSTGVYYFVARFYNTAIQRFTTEDTSPGVKEDPQSLKRYAHVEDNPLTRTDFSGNSDQLL